MATVEQSVMKRDCVYAFAVYLVEVAVVIAYVAGWIPVHPIVLMLPLVGLFNYKVEGKGHEGLGLVIPRSLRPFLLALIFAALSIAENLVCLHLEGVSLQFFSFSVAIMGSVIKSLAIDLFIIALWEEIVSRGYIQTRLQKAWGLWGVVMNTLLFATLHLPSALTASTLPEVAFRFLQTGLSGFVLSYLYWKSGSVLVTILLHGLRNTAASLVSYLSGLSFAQVIAAQVPFQLLWSAGEVVLMIFACRFFLVTNDSTGK
jgi:membrane protease YdiL (CAAX protease family)